MSRRAFRDSILAQLQAHPWITNNGISVFNINHTQEVTAAFEEQLDADHAGIVIGVSPVTGGKRQALAGNGKRSHADLTISVVVKANQGNLEDPDIFYDAIDEVIKAIQGASQPGTRWTTVYEGDDFNKDSSVVLEHYIRFTGRVDL